ncbi:MAG: alpha/beta hydrolase family protein [Candidatus Acidiferrales bacterium]
MNNFGRVLPAGFLLLLCGLATPARAAMGRAECNSLSSRVLGHPVAYCILLPPTYDTEKTRRYPVVYYLHGLGDTEQMFIRSGGWNLTEDLWEQDRLGEFLIATPAGDSSFYINSHDGRVRYEDFLLKEFLPFIEGKYRIRSGRADRGIAGISMGGYGALRLAFLHPQLFEAVSVHSAALMEKLPEVPAAAAEQVPSLLILGRVFGSPPDRSFWDRNNPLVLAKSAPLASLKIYFDCGTEDDYGFYAGAAVLDKELTSRGISHEFHLYGGGHDWRYFAEHLPASLEFQSRAFGLGPATK